MQPVALLEDAAVGRLPAWAAVGPGRYAHMERVAALLGEWAEVLALPPHDCIRWRAAGMLHDGLREASTESLRTLVPAPLDALPGKLLHGPAAAARLRADGVDDEPLLRAIAYHTLGHPELDDLGRALFIADYIEPGRSYEVQHLAELRSRMPADRDDVLRDVLSRRLLRLIAGSRPIRPETAAFWNAVTGVRAPAS